MTYLKERLGQLGITDEINTFRAIGEDGVHSIAGWKFFTETEKGDISINYLSPDGAVEWYNHGNSQTRQFSRIRKASPGDGPKYVQTKGTESIPFSTPTVIKAYKGKEQIKTLYVTEGEFKAFKLSMLGVPCIGIGGIQNYRNRDKDELHPYIIDIMQRCKVENVVLLFDRDCLDMTWAEGKELTTRLNSFYNALNTFNELIKPYDVQLYFAHVSRKCNADQKGIDDLLCSRNFDEVSVLAELKSLTAGANDRQYIDTYRISGLASGKIKQIFGLFSVENFYENYHDELKDHDFKYNGIVYYINDKDKPVRSWGGAQRQYIRVGTAYYKLIVKKEPNGQVELNLEDWNADTIKADYSNSKEFLKGIAKFDAFTNIPENDPAKYKAEIVSEKDGVRSMLYNRYCPVTHVPSEGRWPTINRLLHHIFDYKNNNGESMYEFALDYIQMCYLKPCQKLPILCLISTERETGKTTFLNLLRSIFLENMRILDSERISSKFNGSWAGKLIVAVDESFIDTDKPTVVNRLKMIATNPTIPIEKKGKEAGEVPNFSKLIMCSNDETNFLKIELEETRYAIIKVGTIPDGQRDPHMLEHMNAEIPAFLFFLSNRQLYHEERNRLFFAPEDYATPALKKIQSRTENLLVKNLKYVVEKQFEYSRKDFVEMSLDSIYDLVKAQYNFADKMKIREFLNDKGLVARNATNFRIYTDDINYIERKGRVYHFEAKEWLSEEAFNSIFVENT